MPVDGLDLVIRYGGTILAGAVGVGIGWATIRERSKAFQVAIDKEIRVMSERLAKTEGKIEAQVGEAKCQTYRTTCQQNLFSEMEEMKTEIRDNRNLVITKFEELMRFVGKVEEFMLRYSYMRKGD